MKMLLILEAFETITDPTDVQRLRELIKNKVPAIHSSSKVTESGVLADSRGAFFVLEVDSGEHLTRLLFPIQDLCRIKAHPITSFEDLGKLFSEEQA